MFQEKSKGRVSTLLPQAHDYGIFGPSQSSPKNGFEPTTNGIPSTPVSNLYFSKRNIDALQHGIRYSVYKRTDKVIDNQSEFELLAIMRSIYFQYSENRQHDVVGQVRELNARVLDYAVDVIVNELQMQQTYLRDISQLPTPIPRSINTSMRGTKVLELTDL